MTSSGLGRNRSRLAPARRLEKLPSLGPARSPKKVKDRRQLTCAGTGKDGAVEPRRARQGEATPTQGPISSPAAGPGGGRADLEPAHGLSRISSASALTRTPLPPAGLPDPPCPVGALSARPVCGQRTPPDEVRAAGSLPQTEPRTRGRRPRPHPHPPGAPRAQAAGGRGRGAATVAAARPRPRRSHATPHPGPDPPALLPRPGPGPGLHTAIQRRRQLAWLAPHR